MIVLMLSRLGRPGSIATLMGLLFSAPALAAPKAIRAGRLIDPSGNVVINAVIVVENDRIVSVGTSAPPAGAEIIDLSRYSVIPGLIDLHTHMTYFWDPASGTRRRSPPATTSSSAPAGTTRSAAAAAWCHRRARG